MLLKIPHVVQTRPRNRSGLKSTESHLRSHSMGSSTAAQCFSLVSLSGKDTDEQKRYSGESSPITGSI